MPGRQPPYPNALSSTTSLAKGNTMTVCVIAMMALTMSSCKYMYCDVSRFCAPGNGWGLPRIDRNTHHKPGCHWRKHRRWCPLCKFRLLGNRKRVWCSCVPCLTLRYKRDSERQQSRTLCHDQSSLLPTSTPLSLSTHTRSRTHTHARVYT